MHGAVLLDERDQVVRPALIWCDVRTGRQCVEFTKKVGAERLIRLTCNPALPNFTLTKFLWVRENEPPQWRRVRSVMLPKDYVRFRLTGERDRRGGRVGFSAGCCKPSLVARDSSGCGVVRASTLYESPEVCAGYPGRRVGHRTVPDTSGWAQETRLRSD
jgi:xylulokinase